MLTAPSPALTASYFNKAAAEVLEQLAEGRRSEGEALASAEALGSIAAAVGGPWDALRLALLRLERASSERRAGAEDRAVWFEQKGRVLLRLLADRGSVDARQVLEALPPADNLLATEQEIVAIEAFGVLARAAVQGDLDAITQILTILEGELREGWLQPIEATAAGLVFARLGWITRHSVEMGHCAGELLARQALLEEKAAHNERAAALAAEAMIVFAEVSEAGNEASTQMLADMVRVMPKPITIAAAKTYASILGYVIPEGMA